MDNGKRKWYNILNYPERLFSMKKRDYANWKKTDHYQGMLLFAQTVEECTFPYSYESYKAPALNSHYLCYDINMTARDIEAKVLMDGNFVPLAEEFERMLDDDLFIGRIMPDRGVFLLTKNKNADYYDLTEETLAAKIRNYPEVARYINDLCETQNMYLSTILDEICENVSSQPFVKRNRMAIYNATRMFVTELINSGYNKQYIYSKVEEVFFNPQKVVEGEINEIVDFFNCFIGESYTFKVGFGINRKAAYLFNRLDDFEVSIPNGDEKKLFNKYKKGDRVVTVIVEALDPYSAFEQALENVDRVLAIHRINQHDSRLFISSKGCVAKKNGEDEYDNSIVIYTPQNLMKKKGNAPDMHAFIGDCVFLDRIEPPASFYRAVALHNGAIENTDVSNQLLNLWTILEVLISTRRDNEDRINTICNILCSVLNRSYMFSCLEQLLHDIDVCTNYSLMDVILQQIENESEMEPTEKFALLLALEEYAPLRTNVIEALIDYPLLVYRVNNFSEIIFENSKSIYDFLKRHEKRIRWHIMRIYRNRNMIVHNGSYMPYVNMIAENLHFYVDELLDVLVEYYHIGITNNSSIYKNISCEEVSYYRELGVNVTKSKVKQNSVNLTKDNALAMIFNGYKGKMVQKAITKAIEKSKNEREIPSKDVQAKISS